MAGVDCSTQATKVLIVDLESGSPVAEGRAPHAVTGEDGARESDPAVWSEALRLALAQTGLAARVEAIAVAGQQHGLVLHDGSGRPLRPAPLWSDTRSAGAAGALVERQGADWWAARTGSVPVASFTATKWQWLRETEPDVTARAAGACLPHDWLNLQLTGEAVTDRGDASGTGWWNSATEAYDDEILGLIELPAGLLPRIAGPREPAGVISAGAASRLGLRAGVHVGAGTGDNMAAALGLGLAPGHPVVSLGTSGAAYASMVARPVDAEAGIACFADATGAFLPLACTINCTLAVDWFAALLGLERDDVSPSAGVVALPYLAGERTPNLPDATATITGVRSSTPPQAVLQAAYEGAAFSLRPRPRRAGRPRQRARARRADRPDRRRGTGGRVAGDPGAPLRTAALLPGDRGGGRPRRGRPGGGPSHRRVGDGLRGRLLGPADRDGGARGGRSGDARPDRTGRRRGDRAGGGMKSGPPRWAGDLPAATTKASRAAGRSAEM